MLLLLAAAFAALEWAPDPLAAADRAARAAAGAGDTIATADAADGSAPSPAEALRIAQEAGARAPRRALAHLVAAALARDGRQDELAAREIERAARAEPCRGPVQRVVANDRLIDAVLHHDQELLNAAARAFAAAVAAGELSCLDAYDSLRAAEAPAGCYDLVAGRDPERLEALVEHHAFSLATDDALAVADRLDALRADPKRRGRALAERRLGAACFTAGRAAEAALRFRAAAELLGQPDGFALDRADAHFAAGNEEEGAKHLLHALATGEADAERAAGSIRCAADEQAAAQALLAAGLRAKERDLRERCAAVFHRLGQPDPRNLLLVAGDPR
jgi:hypothetical protein